MICTNLERQEAGQSHSTDCRVWFALASRGAAEGIRTGTYCDQRCALPAVGKTRDSEISLEVILLVWAKGDGLLEHLGEENRSQMKSF